MLWNQSNPKVLRFLKSENLIKLSDYIVKGNSIQPPITNFSKMNLDPLPLKYLFNQGELNPTPFQR